MKPHTATPAAEPARNFTERYGGWILSGCCHIILFSVLLMARQPAHRRVDVPIEPIRVTLSASVDAALPGAPAAPVADGAAASARTGGPPAPEPEVAIQQARPLAPLAPPQPTPVAEQDAALGPGSLAAALRPVMTLSMNRENALAPGTPTDNAPGSQVPGASDDSNLPHNPKAGGSTEPGPAAPDGSYAQGAVRKRGDGVGGPGTEAGSAGVGARLQAARAGLTADKTLFAPKNLFAARGASEGAIRSITLGGAPDETTKEVLGRYGIKIVGAPFNAGASYLSGQAVGQEQFVTRFAGGATAMFSFTSIGAGKMVQLEEDALRKAGYDPASTRIVMVTYGVVNTPRGYDLGVVDMKTEPLMLPKTRTYEKADPVPEKTPAKGKR